MYTFSLYNKGLYNTLQNYNVFFNRANNLQDIFYNEIK